eukprot:scaffold14674_cov24-Cyclotella_meneghiniana.AAC.1
MAHRLLREEDGYTDLHIFLKVNSENVEARLVRIRDYGPGRRIIQPDLLLDHPEELTRFGESICFNKSLRSCTVGLGYRQAFNEGSPPGSHQ